MIAKLKGIIDELKPTELILDVGGVGFELTIPLSTYEKIQSEKEVAIYVYTYHKEDQLRLFGFYSEKEKNLFLNLINISGIGPAMAVSIISGISIDRLIEAVRTENASLLIRIPGIGKSKAEKLIFELKRKFNKIESLSEESKETSAVKNDAVEALVSLGFDDLRSSRIVDEILKENPESSIEYIIKQALKDM